MRKHGFRCIAISAVGLVLALVSCKVTETETEYVDRIVEVEKEVPVYKEYATSVTFTATGGEGAVSVEMASETEGATIYYTTDDSSPTTQSAKYTDAVEITDDTSFRAIAVKDGLENSPVSFAKFSVETKTETTVQIEYQEKIVEKEVEKEVKVPAVYVSAVTYNLTKNADGSVSIAMATATEGATIHYTSDGSAPTSSSTTYSTAVTVNADTTFTAIAVKDGIEDSPVSYAKVSISEKTIPETQVIEKEYVSAVEFAATDTDSGVELTLSTATAGAEILYTTDGTTPSANSTKYTGAIAVSENTTVKAIAIKDGIEDSPVSVSTVRIKKIASTSGNSGNPLAIALTSEVPHLNGYTGTKSNTSVTVTANITSADAIKKVVWKKNGSLIAKVLLSDSEATAATVSASDNTKWTFTINATDETANGTYTVAAIDNAGREEAEEIEIDCFDFTPPNKVIVATGTASNIESLYFITLSWSNPAATDFDHLEITYTYNNGTAESELSEAVTIAKGTTTKSFTIDNSNTSYTYYIVTVDEVGNKSDAVTKKVNLGNNETVPEGFVAVTGATIVGTETWTPSSSVFVSGRSITIPDLYVCDHEVTRGEYKDIVGTDPSTANAYDKDGNKLTGDDVLNNPVNYVNWYNALVYCNKLSIKKGLDPCYTISNSTDPDTWGTVPTSSNTTWNAAICDFTANGYRLPTEAEWEWLARGGESYTYSGSNTVGDVAWYTNNTNSTGSREVKTKNANAYGIYDMSGNVGEWCWDWYSFNITSSTAASGASSGDSRVQRGGSWGIAVSFCAVSFRSSKSPYNCGDFNGFRVVRTAK